MLALGLNSGSSFDGVDVVLVDIAIGEDGLLQRPRFIAGKTVAWPQKIADQVLAAFENKLSIFELCRLNYVAGALYAEAARSLMRETGVAPQDLAVIGFDGQTIYQEPADQKRMKLFADDEDIVGRWLDGPYPCGLQIAEPAIVAAVCDTTVVTQFRPVEHALGGSGAPLMQFLDFVAFREIGPVLTLNIGGIANCQLADADRRRMMAFDTGPGNVMLDHAARALPASPTTPTAPRLRAARSRRACWRGSSRTNSSTASRRAAPGASTSVRRSPNGRSQKTAICRPRICSRHSPSSRRFRSRGRSATTSRSSTKSRR
jgi:anhydro-N-acetylmuramic acid kinase